LRRGRSTIEQIQAGSALAGAGTTRNVKETVMATGRSCGLLLAILLAQALASAARADLQLDDLPRSMTISEADFDRVPITDRPVDRALASDDRPIDLLATFRRENRFEGATYGAPEEYPEGYPCPTPQADCYGDPWVWQLLPQGVIYHSYLAGPREPRMASVWQNQTGNGWLWDFTIGGRIGLLRYGTPRGFRPDGFEIDIEGAAFPQLVLNYDRDLQAVDFRGGVPLTYGLGPFQAKFAFYHLSSHIGDEFFIKNPTFNRINFSRDVLVLGTGYFLTDAIRVYGEAGWAFYTDGGTEPWEFQFGAEYSPINAPTWRGSPFAAINAHLRQEVNFGGSLVVQVGWQWLQVANGTRLRTGFQYFNGKNEQYQFYYNSIQQFGVGVWYDF